MKLRRVRRAWTVLLVASFAGFAAPVVVFRAYAQDYPAKPVRIIVPLAPGGIADNLARQFGQKFTDSTRQPVIVDNRPGGAGAIGMEGAAKSPADGYTLFLGGSGSMAVIPHLNPNLTVDTVRDFVAVAHLVTVDNFLVVHPSVPARSVAELVALARSKPGQIAYASQGSGSSGHMAGELFRQVAKIDVIHVPYKGAAPAVQDLLGGQVAMMFDSVMVSIPHVKGGKLRALAITSAARNAAVPDVPTMAEAGFAEIQTAAWFGLYAPAGTPRPIIEFLNRESNRIFALPEIHDRLVSQGAAIPLSSPEALARLTANDRDRWGHVIKAAGIRAD